jgi:hypothetical protein
MKLRRECVDRGWVVFMAGWLGVGLIEYRFYGPEASQDFFALRGVEILDFFFIDQVLFHGIFICSGRRSVCFGGGIFGGGEVDVCAAAGGVGS